MRKLCLLCALGAVLLVGSLARADCNDPFGKPEEVLDFHFKIARADWTKLLASRVSNPDGMPPGSPACLERFTEFKAEFRCGGEGPFLKVSLRRKKGEERGVEAFEKPPMKMDINEDFMGTVPEAKGQRWPAPLGDLGFRKLTLNNGTANKSADGVSVLSVLHSEHVGLRLLARDVPLSPRTAYAKVTMHFDGMTEGEYLGVYILIEDLDRSGLRRRGLDGNGRLEKQSTADCAPEMEFDDSPANASKAAYDAFIAKNPAQFSGKWLEEAKKGLDVDIALRQEAIREILINGNDTIFNSINPTTYLPPRLGWGNNWFAHDPLTGVRQYAPWDLDLAFGQQNTFCGPDYVPGGKRLQCPATTPLLTWCTGGRPFPKTTSALGLLLPCNPEIQKRYLEIMCQETNGPLAADEILKIWNQVYETLKPVVPLETARTWKGIDPMAPPPNAGVLETFGSEYERLKAWIPARIKFVQQEITRLGVACASGCTTGAMDTCSHLGCPSQRRCENGRWTACLPTNACNAAPPADGGVVKPPVDGGAPRSDASGAGGSGGAAGRGGGGPDGAAGSGPPPGGGEPTGGSGGGTPPPPPGGKAGGGCQCDTGSPTGSPSWAALALVALLATRRRRYESRRR